jgi:hypothetical protein
MNKGVGVGGGDNKIRKIIDMGNNLYNIVVSYQVLPGEITYTIL